MRKKADVLRKGHMSWAFRAVEKVTACFLFCFLFAVIPSCC